MANIFKLTKDYVNPPKRNSYDLSYQNDFTAKFGTLYPIFIKEVNPGDSFSIQTNLGIRAEPMVFPVQSKMRADVHYFYVRNRTLWEGWMDFIGKTDDTLEHPYIVQPNSFFKSKTLADFLGVPTSIVGGVSQGFYYQNNSFTINGGAYYPNTALTAVTLSTEIGSISTEIRKPIDISQISSNDQFTGPYTPALPLISAWTTSSSPYAFFRYIGYGLNGYTGIPSPICKINDIISSLRNIASKISDNVNSFSSYEYSLFVFLNSILDTEITTTSSQAKCRIFFGKSDTRLTDYTEITSHLFNITTYVLNNATSVSIVPFATLQASSNIEFMLTYLEEALVYGFDRCVFLFGFDSTSRSYGVVPTLKYGEEGYYSFGNIVYAPNVSRDLSYDSSESQMLPWVTYSSANPAVIKLSALPFRAYEAIYNSYYRNYMNNPFMLNGKPQYNRYVTNLGDGADTTPYKLFNRNWELDFLTSAQQSPQQGEAPLVGITINPNSTATMKFKSSELESAGVANGEVTATVEIDENTNMLGISYYDKQLPQSNLKRLMEAINYGISINDLRQTTALQRWLEKNILKGFRYIDQVKAHFGVDVSYRDLLMPEFIGGHSQAINTITISQTTPTGDSPLGSYGGQAISKSSSENTVTKYCDEAGFIIGIMSIVPTPVYSQVPQQFFYRSNVLDYYFPEFGSIGMQPIFNKDITPLQTDKDKLDDVFGYQRPWWHLISSIDEVHGEFRTNRQGYLIQRMFEETPILNGDFLTINNDAINNVFYVDDEQSDQFLCQAYFKVTKKTAIPLFGVPAIENTDVN